MRTYGFDLLIMHQLGYKFADRYTELTPLQRMVLTELPMLLSKQQGGKT